MTDESTGTPTPEEVFGLVADETRFDILRAIRDVESAEPSFAEIREEAGVRDSGRFNYHLDKLTDRFVRKTDDGYELTYAGLRVLGAAISGVYTDPDRVDVSMSPDYDCYECGGPIETEYESGVIRMTCADCGALTAQFAVPPILAATTDVDDRAAVFSRHLLTTIQRTARGICNVCNARVIGSLYEEYGEDFEVEDVTHGAEFECDECGHRVTLSLGAVAAAHPPVAGFLHDRGYDLSDEPIWRLDFLFRGETTVVSEDPLHVRVRIDPDGGDDDMTVTFDDDLSVVDYERV